MKGFFQNNKINWKESQMHGVIRRLKSRQHWDKRWEEVMRAEPKLISHLNLVQLENTFYDAIRGENLPENIVNRNKNFQQGGNILLGAI
jgi:deoxyribodipyrimidine photo-lyase